WSGNSRPPGRRPCQRRPRCRARRIAPRGIPRRAPRSPAGSRRRCRTTRRRCKSPCISGSRGLDSGMTDSLHGLAGLVGVLGLAFVLSESRGAVPWRSILVGVALQVLLALIFLKLAWVKSLFLQLNDVLLALDKATAAGTSLVFGYLGGGDTPFAVKEGAST